jgi:hypothetical protein
MFEETFRLVAEAVINALSVVSTKVYPMLQRVTAVNNPKAASSLEAVEFADAYTSSAELITATPTRELTGPDEDAALLVSHSKVAGAADAVEIDAEDSVPAAEFSETVTVPGGTGESADAGTAVKVEDEESTVTDSSTDTETELSPAKSEESDGNGSGGEADADKSHEQDRPTRFGGADRDSDAGSYRVSDSRSASGSDSQSASG